MTVRPEAVPAKPGAARPIFDRVLLKVSGENGFAVRKLIVE